MFKYMFAPLLIITLTACAIPPASGTPTAVTDPETAIMYAAATGTAASNLVASTNTAQAIVAQEARATQAAANAQATAVAIQTANAVHARQTAVMRETETAATSTAQWMSTRENLQAEQTRSALNIHETREAVFSMATATAVSQQAIADAERNERRGQWATVGMWGLGAFLASAATFLIVLSIRLWQRNRPIRDRNGFPMAIPEGWVPTAIPDVVDHEDDYVPRPPRDDELPGDRITIAGLRGEIVEFVVPSEGSFVRFVYDAIYEDDVSLGRNDAERYGIGRAVWHQFNRLFTEKGWVKEMNHQKPQITGEGFNVFDRWLKNNYTPLPRANTGEHR